ncbi:MULTISPECIES: PEGA domain-containing protein [unclassified Methanoregula]|uniref:PEGA domain-containing protein n=1 Tax=unclassified Methanoregula TaxID=2649730 RepID=UPI0025CD4945|nr:MULTISPECIES: PEGA domain-containing protein [unclassified Methanoregula]
METDVDFTIAGKNFNKDYIDDVFLSIDDFDTNISADDFKVDSSTKITGTFDLGDVDEEGDYDICIIDDFGSVECKKKAFEVITNAEGTLEIDSNPSGAAIYIDNVANGTTPRDIDILVGTYKVILKKAGYQDWSKTVNVQEDETTTIDATLYAAPTATPTQTQSTPYPTATPTTARTTIKSTMKIPTTYAEVPTTTAASPIEPWVIIGAVCLALIALRKR